MKVTMQILMIAIFSNAAPIPAPQASRGCLPKGRARNRGCEGWASSPQPKSSMSMPISAAMPMTQMPIALAAPMPIAPMAIAPIPICPGGIC